MRKSSMALQSNAVMHDTKVPFVGTRLGSWRDTDRYRRRSNGGLGCSVWPRGRRCAMCSRRAELRTAARMYIQASDRVGRCTAIVRSSSGAQSHPTNPEYSAGLQLGFAELHHRFPFAHAGNPCGRLTDVHWPHFGFTYADDARLVYCSLVQVRRRRARTRITSSSTSAKRSTYQARADDRRSRGGSLCVRA